MCRRARLPGQAIGHYRKAAARGVTGAQFNLAVRYEQGRGVPQDSPPPPPPPPY